MKKVRSLLSAIIFAGGAAFGLAFAQRKGSELRSKVSAAIKSGRISDVLSTEFSGIGQDVWQTSLGLKNSKEVQKFVEESQEKFDELGKVARKHGGEVAKIIGKEYEKMSANLAKQAKELKTAAGRTVVAQAKVAKKAVKKEVRKVMKKVAKAGKVAKKAPAKKAVAKKKSKK